MSRLPPADRMQPSLLDRLTDDDPTARHESRDRQLLSMQKLRECVLRDLSWLLNTGNLETLLDLEHLPAVADSTVNYGIPHLAGLQASAVEATDMERRLRQALIRFEPRILSDTVKIRTAVDEGGSQNTVTFFIEGMLWADPVPWQLYLKTEADLELGTFKVTEHSGREDG